MSKRYYLHGDVRELDPNQYYCALCDSFENKEHFLDTFHKVNNQEKYSGAIERFKKANKNFLKHNFRPSNANNLFSDLPKKKARRFYRWLKKQQQRNDPIGDLAVEALSDACFPSDTDSLVLIKNHLNFHGAFDEAIQALTEAFNEFKKKKQNRSSISLKTRFEVLKADDYKCRICGASVKDEGVQLEVDHKLSRAEGGTDDKSNLWTLCFKCNRGKGTSEL